MFLEKAAVEYSRMDEIGGEKKRRIWFLVWLGRLFQECLPLIWYIQIRQERQVWRWPGWRSFIIITFILCRFSASTLTSEKIGFLLCMHKGVRTGLILESISFCIVLVFRTLLAFLTNMLDSWLDSSILYGSQQISKFGASSVFIWRIYILNFQWCIRFLSSLALLR